MIDQQEKIVINNFGKEWKSFKQDKNIHDLNLIFDNYFNIFPFHIIDKNSVGVDIGCGTGRWAEYILPKVKKLYLVEPSLDALNIAKKRLINVEKCVFINSDANNLEMIKNPLDFAYSLGVLHHIKDTLKSIKTCSDKLKKGAPFLIYLYYNFENRGLLFVTIWKISNYFRIFISRLPFFIKKRITDFIALTIYLPLKYMYIFFEFMKFNVSFMPLYFYKNKSFYTMRTDSLDRFGTIIEKRFSKKDISKLLESAGFEKIGFSKQEPYWTAICYKK